MKVREIEVDVKIIHDDGSEAVITVKDSYQEPESLSEIPNLQMNDSDKLRAFCYGLYNIHSGKIRSSNNLGSLARKLVDAKVFSSTKEALEFIIRNKKS